MTRSITALALAAALAACNGDDDGGPTPASGTIMGSQFDPTDGGALVLAAAPCDFGLGPYTITVLAMGFSSFPNLCGFVSTAGLCGDVQSSVIVSATILRAQAAGTPGPIAPGTYAIGTTDDGQGNLLLASADITKVDGVCTALDGAGQDVQSGSITLSTVSPRVTGSLDVTFNDGSHFAGSFDLSICNAAVDFCTVITDSCASTPCCTDATTCT